MKQNRSDNNTLRAFYQDYVEAANKRDYQAIEALVAKDVLLNGNRVERSSVIEQFKILIAAIPDFHWQIQQLIIEGEDIAARLNDTGTPIANSLFGENPNQKSVRFTEFASYRVQNGKFIEMWFLIDHHAIAEQLKN